MAGIPIGVKNLHYALVTTDDDTTLAYGDPVALSGVVSVNVKPNSSSETIFADDGPFETAATTGNISVELQVASLTIEEQAVLLGHTIAAGVMKQNSSDNAPYVAIGFESIKSNGSKRFVWLTKGKFAEPEDAYETKGDSIKFQPQTITGSFVAREHDGNWKITGDEDATGWVAPTGGWYTADVLEA